MIAKIRGSRKNIDITMQSNCYRKKQKVADDPIPKGAGRLSKTGIYDVAAVKQELLSDSITPILLLRRLLEKSSHKFLF